MLIDSWPRSVSKCRARRAAPSFWAMTMRLLTANPLEFEQIGTGTWVPFCTLVARQVTDVPAGLRRNMS